MELGLHKNGCIYVRTVVHELLHSLGFMHEQSRPDRDDFIRIEWWNLKVNFNLGLLNALIDINFRMLQHTIT